MAGPDDLEASVRREQAEERARERAKKRAALRAKGRDWLGAQGLMPIAWAALAGVGAIALFGLAAFARIPCGPDSCPVVAGVPAGILETAAVGVLLAGLASAGAWISRLTQRTWTEKLRLQRAELDIGKGGDADRRRRLEAVLDPDSGVASIHAQARLSFWAGLPVSLVSLALTPYALSTFADVSAVAGYLLPVVVLGLVAGVAACVRGLVLGSAARRLTRPLREPKPRRGSKSGKAKARTSGGAKARSSDAST